MAFLDDDDMWHPMKATKQIAALGSQESAVACACWGWYIDADGNLKGSWSPVGDHPSAEYIAGIAPLPRIVTLVFRRAVCEEVRGFDEACSRVEDLEFTFRVLLRGECAAVPEKLVYYRQHDANISHGVTIEARDASLRMLVNLIRLCEERGDLREAALFRMNLVRWRRESCLRSLRGARAAVRKRSRSGFAAEARWLAKHSTWLPGAMPGVWAHLRAR